MRTPTPDRETLERQLAAIDGRVEAIVDRRSWRTLAVGGGDAGGWLGDLLTSDLAGMGADRAARALLLSPTGRIRADVHVYRRAEDFIIVQDPRQPRAIQDLLAPYVLSSDVLLSPFDGGMVCRLHVRHEAGDWMPSMLPDAVDRLSLPHQELPDRPIVQEPAVEIWRIRRGIPRFPADVGEDSLPSEAGLDAPHLGVIDATKGCFLGQEAVAKVRNLGHPPRLVVALWSSDPVSAGDTVLWRDRQVGAVTSAAPDGRGGTAVLARVRWDARDRPLATSTGGRLERR